MVSRVEISVEQRINYLNSNAIFSEGRIFIFKSDCHAKSYFALARFKYCMKLHCLKIMVDKPHL